MLGDKRGDPLAALSRSATTNPPPKRAINGCCGLWERSWWVFPPNPPQGAMGTAAKVS